MNEFRHRSSPRLRVPFETVGPSMTKQSFASELDVNRIVARGIQSGFVRQHVGSRYLDLPDATDYHTAMNQVLEAQAAFNALPSALRNRFGNDPAELLVFLSDTGNRAEAIELGLIEPDPPQPEPASPAPEPPAE